MMRPTTRREPTSAIATVLFLAVLFTAPPAFAQPEAVQLDDRAVFDWGAPGSAARLRYPAPPGLVLDDVVEAAISGGGELASFGSSGNPRELLFSIEAPFASPNLVVRYSLAHGDELQVGLGAIEVAEVDFPDEGGPLRVRSTAAPAAGLYLVAALSNESGSPLLLQAVRYLPEPFRPGRLLLAVTDDPQGAMDRVASAFTPSNLGAWERGLEERPEPPLDGFEWVQPASLRQELPAGRSIVLVWSDDAFAAADAPGWFSLRPVVEYELPDEGPGRIGLPLPARSEPTKHGVSWTWNEEPR